MKKQFDAGFLAVAQFPKWVANIVPVPKKDGKVQMCVGFVLYIWIHRPFFDKMVSMPKNVKPHFGRSRLCIIHNGGKKNTCVA